MSGAQRTTRKAGTPPYSGLPTPAQSRDSSAESNSNAIRTIRKKLEHEFSKQSSRKERKSRQSSNVQKSDGTVSSLRPSRALTVPEKFLVVEAAQFMAAKRVDCVLVIDEEERLSGIFTAKDLAFRVVGEGLDARTTTVSRIMTREPKCVKIDTSATFALETMIDRGFRHLPICNEDGDVVGLLDITKCLYEALSKIERAYTSSKKLYDALEGVEKEWTNQPPHIVQYLDILRDKMACPDLSTVLDEYSRPVEVGVRTSVLDAARMMRENHTTAVLVMEHKAIVGIFTSKDIVLRVIAAGLDPATCSVVRVMTPHPDTAPSHTSILDALKKMYNGHYLNLPVVDDGHILGMVDVLKLTYATMEQMYAIQNQQEGQEVGGPWNPFTDDGIDELDSISPSQSASNIPPPSPVFRNRGSGNASPEIHPSESVSVLDEGSMASFPRGNDDNMFTFKFTAPNGKTHRFTIEYDSLENLQQRVKSKLPKTVKNFSLSYVDDDNDQVLMSHDDDVIDAVRIAQRQGLSRVVLSLQEIERSKSRDSPDEELYEEELSGKKSGSKKRRQSKSSKKVSSSGSILSEYLLPGAIAALTMAIVGVFAVSRLSSGR